LFIIIIAYLPSNYEEKIYFIKSDIYSFDNSSDSFTFYQIIVYLLYYLQVVIFISLFIRLYSIHKERKNKFVKEINRPTFTYSQLADKVSFMEYGDVFLWYNRLTNKL